MGPMNGTSSRIPTKKEATKEVVPGNTLPGIRIKPTQHKRTFSSVTDDDDLPLARRIKKKTNKPVTEPDLIKPSDSLSTTPQNKGKPTDKLTTESSSPGSSPLQTKKKATSGATMMSPPDSSPTDQAKSVTAEPDTDSEAEEAEEEREFLSAKANLLSIETKFRSIKAKRLSAKAEVAYRKTRKAIREVRKMDAVLTARMSDIEAREDALVAKLVDTKRPCHWQLLELYAVRERYTDWILALPRKTNELRKIRERRTRINERINLIKTDIIKEAKAFGLNEEVKLLEEDSGDDGDVGKSPDVGDDDDDDELSESDEDKPDSVDYDCDEDIHDDDEDNQGDSDEEVYVNYNDDFKFPWYPTSSHPATPLKSALKLSIGCGRVDGDNEVKLLGGAGWQT
ncbi:hypothetical protein V495_05755 [Pseudogymnoascus sp. VKM F-4514 (FW-929)]|nr:hypothetical protein V495_05755 [Pseudogymnoascus sp. VKM F-4514 (FW-929)]KFY58067.1 hypothetical protein V497_05094 [Pseudogymnoascus sp. VKM F-4516 (FW-969)]